MMWTLLFAVAFAGAPDSEGVRIDTIGGGSGAGVAQSFLVGPDGGVYATTVSARARVSDLLLTVELPFVSYRVPDGRDVGLGNVQLRAVKALPPIGADGGSGSLAHGLGMNVHFAPFDAAWTWINAAEEIWPGAGVDAFWEGRVQLGAAEHPRQLLLRAALGVHDAAHYAPFRDKYVRGQVAVGLDQPIGERFGVVGEMSLQGFDPSPWELAVVGRVTPVDSLRIRAGAVLPLDVWAGLASTGQPAGVREATLLVDAALRY